MLSRHIHFIGIGGIGMSGLAHLCLKKGWRVQGSNQGSSDILKNLEQSGALIFNDHGCGRLSCGVTLIVISSAIQPDNAELNEAIQLGIPVIHRSDFLRHLVSNNRTIAVSGTHGKTTTTSLLGHILMGDNQNPLVISGGIMQGYNSTICAGSGDVAVVEADESDKSHINFNHLAGCVVTNIEAEHMENYERRWDNLLNSFHAFLSLSKEFIMVCGQDEGVRALLSQRVYGARALTYGFDDTCDIWADALAPCPSGTKFNIHGAFGTYTHVESTLWGKHNVLNALAAFGAARLLGLSFSSIAQGFKSFQGVDRRLTYKGMCFKTPVIDDYAHHPTEIKAILDTLHMRGYKKILAICQPHRYTRLRDTMDAFSTCFDRAHTVALLPVYGAGELPIAGINSLSLSHQLRGKGHDVHDVGVQLCAKSYLRDLMKQGDFDVAVCMGAGSITAIATEICHMDQKII